MIRLRCGQLFVKLKQMKIWKTKKYICNVKLVIARKLSNFNDLFERLKKIKWIS